MSVIVNDSVVGCSTAVVAAWSGCSASPITSAAQPAMASPAPPASPAPQRIPNPATTAPTSNAAMPTSPATCRLEPRSLTSQSPVSNVGEVASVVIEVTLANTPTRATSAATTAVPGHDAEAEPEAPQIPADRSTASGASAGRSAPAARTWR